jgi:hypothetical protein
MQGDHWAIAYLLLEDLFYYYRSSQDFQATFSTVHKSCALILTKMRWATFWAIFSQSHLVRE